MNEGERFNTYSHLAGTVLAIVGAVCLIVLAAFSGDVWKIISFSIYSATLVLMYGSSTIYHATQGKVKDFFRTVDHNSIYLLIAGSYTPFTLVTLHGPWGWSLFGVEWGLAVAGILQESWLGKRTRVGSLVIYILMGWTALVAVVPMVQRLGWPGFAWVAGGGIVYTVGIIFYLYDYKFSHWHGIWHLFVLAGSGSHYYAIIKYVA
ncbi:MAG: hemolysin III family protein [Gallionellaceae bacterium]|nr:hemolysin III family protein [Gallionellaceae bacterium]